MSRPGRPPSRPNGMEKRDTSKDFLEETLRVWQPRSDGRLTDDDAREIVSNVAGFVLLLSEWDLDALRTESLRTNPDADSGGRPT